MYKILLLSLLLYNINSPLDTPLPPAATAITTTDPTITTTTTDPAIAIPIIIIASISELLFKNSEDLIAIYMSYQLAFQEIFNTTQELSDIFSQRTESRESLLKVFIK